MDYPYRRTKHTIPYLLHQHVFVLKRCNKFFLLFFVDCEIFDVFNIGISMKGGVFFQLTEYKVK